MLLAVYLPFVAFALAATINTSASSDALKSAPSDKVLKASPSDPSESVPSNGLPRTPSVTLTPTGPTVSAPLPSQSPLSTENSSVHNIDRDNATNSFELGAGNESDPKDSGSDKTGAGDEDDDDGALGTIVFSESQTGIESLLHPKTMQLLETNATDYQNMPAGHTKQPTNHPYILGKFDIINGMHLSADTPQDVIEALKQTKGIHVSKDSLVYADELEVSKPFKMTDKFNATDTADPQDEGSDPNDDERTPTNDGSDDRSGHDQSPSGTPTPSGLAAGASFTPSGRPTSSSSLNHVPESPTPSTPSTSASSPAAVASAASSSPPATTSRRI
ncbi:hypothetical protein PYCC9005_001228 [Savitreella phatthalungensis]